MAKNYLDPNGVLYLWQKIKNTFVKKTDLSKVGSSNNYNDLDNLPSIPTKLSELTNDNNTVQDANYSGLKSSVGTLETKVAALENLNPQENVVETVKVNNTALVVDKDKAVNVTIQSGSTNGTLSVNGSNISVKGLDTAAYKKATDFDASGSAAAVLGQDTDTATKNTVYGAKAYADSLDKAMDTRVDAIEAALGSGGSVATQISTEINKLDSSVKADTGYVLTGVTETDGKLSAKEQLQFVADNMYALPKDSSDTTSAKTSIAKRIIDLEDSVSAFEAAIGDGGSVSAQISTEIKKLDSNTAATSGYALTGVTITDGKISSKTEAKFAPLNSSNLIDAKYLPSYVDDVIEVSIISSATALSAGWLAKSGETKALTPEAGKIYVVTQTGEYEDRQYRWSGSTYVEISSGGMSPIQNSEIDDIISSS